MRCPWIPAPQQLHVDAWAETTTAADRHNDPGHFTALIGWEWSSLPPARISTASS